MKVQFTAKTGVSTGPRFWLDTESQEVYIEAQTAASEFKLIGLRSANRLSDGQKFGDRKASFVQWTGTITVEN